MRERLSWAGAMTRTKLRRSLIEQAAQLVLVEACRECQASDTKVLGHTERWRLVRIAPGAGK